LLCSADVVQDGIPVELQLARMWSCTSLAAFAKSHRA